MQVQRTLKTYDSVKFTLLFLLPGIAEQCNGLQTVLGYHNLVPEPRQHTRHESSCERIIISHQNAEDVWFCVVIDCRWRCWSGRRQRFADCTDGVLARRFGRYLGSWRRDSGRHRGVQRRHRQAVAGAWSSRGCRSTVGPLKWESESKFNPECGPCRSWSVSSL